MTAILSWEPSEFGANGGVLLDEDLTYTVFTYDITNEELSIVAQGIKDTSYQFKSCK